MTDDPFALVAEHRDKIEDRFEGWELVEFLDLSAEQILDAARDNGWIDEDNLEDFLDFVGLRNDN